MDGRPLKTPGGNGIRLPRQKKLFATLVANEWDVQDTILKPHTLPLVSSPCWSHTKTKKHQTSIASRAIDGLTEAENRLAVANTLLRYFDTDTIWCDERLIPINESHGCLVIMNRNLSNSCVCSRTIGILCSNGLENILART